MRYVPKRRKLINKDAWFGRICSIVLHLLLLLAIVLSLNYCLDDAVVKTDDICLVVYDDTEEEALPVLRFDNPEQEYEKADELRENLHSETDNREIISEQLFLQDGVGSPDVLAVMEVFVYEPTFDLKNLVVDNQDLSVLEESLRERFEVITESDDTLITEIKTQDEYFLAVGEDPSGDKAEYDIKLYPKDRASIDRRTRLFGVALCYVDSKSGRMYATDTLDQIKGRCLAYEPYLVHELPLRRDSYVLSRTIGIKEKRVVLAKTYMAASTFKNKEDISRIKIKYVKTNFGLMLVVFEIVMRNGDVIKYNDPDLKRFLK